MGFLKDMRTLKKQADALTPARAPRHRRRLPRPARRHQRGHADPRRAASARPPSPTTSPSTASRAAPSSPPSKDTGMSVNDNPRVELTLEVTVADKAPYTATHAPGHLAHRGRGLPAGRDRPRAASTLSTSAR